MSEARWRDCVQHRGAEVREFVEAHFGDPESRVLLVGGAGFDPRSCVIADLISEAASSRLSAVFLREERPEPDSVLRERAAENVAKLGRTVSGSSFVNIEAFAPDNAAVVGREAVAVAEGLDLNAFTDVVLDFSALSVGASFPLARYLLDRATSSEGVSLHLMVAASALVDEAIRSESSDVVSPVHGFRGGWGLESNRDAALLWMPLLARGKRSVLQLIHGVVDAHDVAPILPFPGSHPKAGDQLVDHFREELEQRWGVDSRDLVYAEENNPVDLYTQILGLDARRRPVFGQVRSSLTVLTPTGSKVLAMGVMMAAIERDLPVLYAENVAYELDSEEAPLVGPGSPELVHVWLHVAATS